MYDQNVDLGDFCELLDRECGLIADELGDGDDTPVLKRVQKECRGVLKELQKAVILGGFSGGGYQYSNGVSVFFPWSRDAYEVSRKNYETLWFAKDVKRERLSWTDFLKKYLYEVSLRRFESPLDAVPAGSKYRYYSGVSFDESPRAVAGGTANTKIAGQEGTRIAGQEGTRIAGQEGTRIAGQEGTRIAGQEGTRIAGQEGTRIAGQEGTRIAGGGAGAFFQSMHLFKNVESRWDISGFTRKPDETDRPLISNAKAGSSTT
jgi:hypothetical protein